MGLNMYLIIDLTNGMRDAVGDCEMVIKMILGADRNELEKSYEHPMPEYYFTEEWF